MIINIPKPKKRPEMPKTPMMQFKPEIKTIVADKAVDFDEKVNAELRKGWKVSEIKIKPVDRIYYFATLERLVEVENKNY